MKSRILFICLVAIAIALLAIIMGAIRLFTGYTLTSFFRVASGICFEADNQPSDDYFYFAFVDKETHANLGCHVITVHEEDGTCISSPCPEFSPIYKDRTSKNGYLKIPKRYLDGQVFEPDLATGGTGRMLPDPQYEFGHPDYIQSRHLYSELSTGNQITIELLQKTSTLKD